MPTGVYIRKPMSEEQKRKIGTALRGRQHTEQSKKNMSEGRKGMVLSEEHKKHVGEAAKGRVVSMETRKMQSESNKGKHSQKMPELLYHHTKYKEIHSVDEVVLLTHSEHRRLHNRLRREGKCNIPPSKLLKISSAAVRRRRAKECKSGMLPLEKVML